MTIWTYQRALVRRLLQWSLLSLGVGALLMRGRGFWRGVGAQFIGWALIDMGIAYFGKWSMTRRLEALDDPASPEATAREARSLSALLWVNAALDLLYVRGGRWIARRGRRGTGWGIIVQGMFLFLFDLYHAINVPPASEDR